MADPIDAPATPASDAAVPASAPASQPATPAADAPAADAPAATSQTASTTPTDAPADKPTDAPKTDDNPADGEPAKPVEYEFKLPDGVKLEGEALDELKAFAKEKGLSVEDAQKLADMGAKQAQGFANQILEQQKAVTAEWETQARGDKEFGGDKLDENLGVAKKALDKFGSPELKSMLVSTGLGNHPEVIRLLVRAGKAISEDTRIVTGAANQSDREAKPIANRLYPNQN